MEVLIGSAAVIRERPLAVARKKARWQSQLSKTEAWLGFVQFNTGDSDAALRSYLAALTRLEQLIQKHPEAADLQHDLSGIYAGLGNVLSKRGDKLAARRAF